MSWNYRVIRTKRPDDEPWFEIAEVYYDRDGNPSSWSAGPAAPGGNSLLELCGDAGQILKAMVKPVLEVVRQGEKETLREVTTP